MEPDVIIWLAVLIIIGLQIKIFLETKKKISSYESIMKNPQDFKTYKVFVSENEIETIDSQHILNNLALYTRNPESLVIDKIEKVSENPLLLFDIDNIQEEQYFNNNNFEYEDEDELDESF